MRVFFTIAVLVLDLWALFLLYRSDREFQLKMLWTFVIIILPIIGVIGCLLFNRDLVSR